MSKNLAHLQDYISPLVAIDAGLFISYNVNPTVSFGLSARYFNQTETFEYKEELSSIGILQNEEAFIANGNYISAMQEVEINTSIDIFKYNKLNAYTLRPSLTYFPFRPKKFGMDIHCSLVLYQRYSGALLSDNFKLIKSGPLLDQRRLLTINPGIGFSYSIMYGNLKSKLIIRYQYSQLATNQERHVYGLGLSFSL